MIMWLGELRGVAAIALVGLAGAKLALAEPESQVGPADALFRQGKFSQAAKAYGALDADDPNGRHARLRLGGIALLSNRLDEAKRRLRAVLESDPNNQDALRLLAECHYRNDEFAEAAHCFRAVGREAMARKLESFGDDVPYHVDGDNDAASVKFVLTDPLPLIRVRVNGGEEVYFIIDTGGGEVIIDPDFAERLGVTQFGSETGKFAGDKSASSQHARIDSLQLGEFTIRNVPVHLLGTRAFAAAAGGKRVDGILGTVLLYHFVSTLDYPNEALILRRKGDHARQQVDELARADATRTLPFWMAGDHYMVTRGKLNQAAPCLMFVDTGLAGGGFTCPPSTLKAAGIELSGPSFEGVGGGGPVKVTPFLADDLSLGDVKQKNVMSFFGPFPASLELAHGFRICGLVSHAFFRKYAVTLDFSNMRLFLHTGR